MGPWDGDLCWILACVQSRVKKKILPFALSVMAITTFVWTNKEWFLCAVGRDGRLGPSDWTVGGIGVAGVGAASTRVGPDSWAGCTGAGCTLFRRVKSHETTHHRDAKEKAEHGQTELRAGLVYQNAAVKSDSPGFLPTLLNVCNMLFWSQVWVSSVYNFFWRWSPQLDIVLYQQGWIFHFLWEYICFATLC